MKIRKIKYSNHPILGNLELNFINPDTHQPYENIVFAGENGTGKTTILSTLCTFLNKHSFEPFESIEYEVQGTLFEARKLGDGQNSKFGFHQRINLSDNSSQAITSSAHNSESKIGEDINDIRHCGCVYTKARADYQSKSITSTTASELDTSSYGDDGSDDYTSLKQLIVDVDTMDSRENWKECKKSPGDGRMIDNLIQSSRIHRFQQAFDNFFDSIKYVGVVSCEGKLDVIFEKYGRQISIDDLSTGEKQIVYRGIYLLRNVEKLDGASIMIDEPELSMHPKWQKRILKYFQDLFKAIDGSQKTQMFFATHSEYVLAEALNDKNNTLVIVLKDDNGVIREQEVKTPMALPTITASEINYAAFEIPTIDYHIALYGAIQSKYGVHSINACDEKISLCIPYYDSAKHEQITPNPNKPTAPYKTVCTKVRNHIDHPDTAPSYTDEEMEESIKLMRNILLNVNS